MSLCDDFLRMSEREDVSKSDLMGVLKRILQITPSRGKELVIQIIERYGDDPTCSWHDPGAQSASDHEIERD